MGRPSLAAQRQPELLDAVLRVILRHGLGGVTVAEVARTADVPSSLVHHYLGSRDDMIAAAIARALSSVEALIAERAADGRLSSLFDVIFGERMEQPEIEQLVEHLIVGSYSDAQVRTGLRRVYERFVEVLVQAISGAHPTAPPAAVTAVAHAVLALAHAGPTLAWLDIDGYRSQHLRAAAEQLVAGLA